MPSENELDSRLEGVENGAKSSPRAVIVGLTGGIASGKSTVAAMFAELGAQVLDADTIAHEITALGTAVWSEIKREFGEGILDAKGNIDRRKLGREVFADETKRGRLEQIVHPAVIGRLAAEAQAFRKRCSGVLILEIPLLFETSSLWLVDKIIVVGAEQGTQIERLHKRYGIDQTEALLRIRSQMPLQEKLKLADWVVNADTSLAETRAQVASIWDVLTVPRGS